MEFLSSFVSFGERRRRTLQQFHFRRSHRRSSMRTDAVGGVGYGFCYCHRRRTRASRQMGLYRVSNWRGTNNERSRFWTKQPGKYTKFTTENEFPRVSSHVPEFSVKFHWSPFKISFVLVQAQMYFSFWRTGVENNHVKFILRYHSRNHISAFIF